MPRLPVLESHVGHIYLFPAVKACRKPTRTYVFVDMLAHRPLVVAHMCDLFPLVHLPTGGVVGPLSIWTLNIIKKNAKPHSLLCLGAIFRYTLNNLTWNPKNRSLDQMFFLFNWVNFEIPNVIFQEVLNAENEAPWFIPKGSMYGLFTYMKTIKTNHSCR